MNAILLVSPPHEATDSLALGDNGAVSVAPKPTGTAAPKPGGASRTTSLRDKYGLESWLELEFDTHYHRFFMPTIRGRDEGSKKRYAGLMIDLDGAEEVIYRGLETARSDWTPLAQQFQQGLYRRIFKSEPYAEFVRNYVSKTSSGEFDDPAQDAAQRQF